MATPENNIEKNENGKDADSQEQLAQIALGNTEASEDTLDDDNDHLSTPKTSGTGANPAAATPHSLIVHEDASEEDRYEEGSTQEQEEND